jgi:hypothetical protein
MAASGGSLAGFALKKCKFERNNSCFFLFFWLKKKNGWRSDIKAVFSLVLYAFNK